MHGPINVKSPINTSKWQMGFNSVFKGLIKYHDMKGYWDSGGITPRISNFVTKWR
jgi:hypothetical protein